MTEHPGVAVRPAYTFSKNAGTLFFQLLAQDNAPEKVQITSFNPGTIYADGWKPMGIPPHMFDDGESQNPLRSASLTHLR